MAFPLIPALLGVGSALIGASSASKAAKAQKSAADSQLVLGREQLDESKRQFDLQMGINREVRDDQIARFDPYVQSGGNALNALNAEMGFGAAPAGYNTFQREGFQTSPGYEFMLNEGQRAIEGSAAASGGLLSGATLKALQDRQMGVANQQFTQHQGRQDTLYTNHLNRLAGMSGAGQSAAAGQAQAGGQFGAAAAQAGSAQAASSANATSFMGNALANYGDAAASGAVGVGNALMGGINQGLGVWNYQNQLNAQ